MAKKRDLKQTINYICSELFAEAVAASLYGATTNTESIEELFSTILITRNDFVKRISHPEPGMKAKKYYDKLIMDFNDRVSDIIDQIANLG
jgi:predicted nucleic-acid-binding protein